MTKKDIIKINFEEEPIQNTKPAQKPRKKLPDSEIQRENTAQSEEIAKSEEKPEIPLEDLSCIQPKEVAKETLTNEEIQERKDLLMKSSYNDKSKHKRLIKFNKKKFTEARILMELKLGRKLEIWEIVHHKDENPFNNDLENLEIMTNEEHTSYHSAGKHNPKPINWQPSNKLSQGKINRILECSKENKNYSEIEKELGISRMTASRYIKEVKNNTKKLITPPETPLSELPFIEPKQENEFEKIEELEKKLKEQKELLIIKKKEEKIRKKLEEKLKGKRSLINPLRWFGLKYKKKKELKLEEKIKEPEILEQQSQTEIRLTEDYSNLIFCPICNCKLKKEKVRLNGEIYTQNLKCKNKNCTFTKEIIFKL